MRRRSARYLLLGGCLLGLVMLLLIEGFSTKTIGVASTHASDGGGAPLAGQQPILNYRSGHLVSSQPPAQRRVALTFDDGPDPRWTPQILAILKAKRVPATFFEVGSLVVRNPDITRMIYRDGFQLGNHTFTHADPAALPEWQRSAQIAATESAIVGATGIRPGLVRPPYSSTTDAVTNVQEKAWASIASHGYTIVLSNLDTEDWSQPGVASIIANGTPKGSRGGIILMHDAGGNRSETLEALPLLIDRLRVKGFSFARVSDLAGVPASAVAMPATHAQRLRGQLFDRMLAFAGRITSLLTLLVELVTGVVALRMFAGLALAYAHLRRMRALPSDTTFAPGVTIIVPAYNEAAGIVGAVASLADSEYPGDLEIIVVDDGSTDATGAMLESHQLEHVRLVRQENAGKAAALNRGIRASSHEVIVTVDADTVFEADTLLYLVQRLRDASVGAVSGNTKVGNRNSLVGRWQHIEYVMGFNLDRRTYEMLGATPTVPGAIGAFRKQALADIGGISGATLAEDTDVTLDIGRAGWNVVYEQRARAWTEAPAGLRALYRQRSRWAFGTIQSAWKHRAALWGRSERGRGRRAVAGLAVFQIALPLAAPLIDLFAIYSIIFLDPYPILVFWGSFNFFQMTLAWFAFSIDGESHKPLWALPLQQFIWRQLMYLVVIDSIISALLGSRQAWKHSERTGATAIGGNAFVQPLRPRAFLARELSPAAVAHGVRRRSGQVSRRHHGIPVVGLTGALCAGVCAWAVASDIPQTHAVHPLASALPASVRLNGPGSVNPFAGQSFFISQDSDAYWTRQNWLDANRFADARALEKVAGSPWAHWFGDRANGTSSTFTDVSAEVTQEAKRGALPVLVAYDIPWRDCGGYSSGGATGPGDYAQFIDAMARGIGNNRVVVILEPDALPELDCLPAAKQQAYYAMLNAAVTRLTRNPRTAVYLDAGNRDWQPAAVIAQRLRLAGVARTRGFSLNVSNFDRTAAETRYGTAVAMRLRGAHFLIDTSRDGRGPAPHAQWCNPPGRGLGERPTADTHNPLVDAYFWVKAPGESDGNCGHGAPAAGDWWPQYALMLAENAAF